MDRAQRIAILTIGTRGDTEPYVALARALARRGHDVTIGAIEDYRGAVERKGVRFAPISDSFADFLESDVARLFASRSPLDRLRIPLAVHRMAKSLAWELMEGCWNAIRGADLVIHHPLLIFAPAIAARYGAPAIMAAPQPLAATGAFPICVGPQRDFGRILNRATYGIFALERALLGPTLRAFLHEHVAPDAPADPAPPPELTPSAIFAYSPSIGPVAADWGDAVAVTGTWRTAPNQKWRPSPELETFLSSGPPPIYVGFGSMPWHPQRNRDLIVEAVRRWGGRAVLGRGWGGLAADGLPPEMLSIGNTPHALLFPRLAAVVHHGGAGTTAAGLAAGRPSFVAPILMDQRFWGGRVHALGAGPRPVPLAKLDAPRLAAILDDLTSNAGYRASAEAVAARMAKEDGVGAAVAIVERALARIPLRSP